MIAPIEPPPIVVAADDFDLLLPLARAAARSMPDVSVYLLNELNRAEVIEGRPPDVVAIGSIVSFSEGGVRRRMTLVWPKEAKISAARLSILTPVGAALLGLRTGHSIAWRGPDGKERQLTVNKVE